MEESRQDILFFYSESKHDNRKEATIMHYCADIVSIEEEALLQG
jgi:hypothetical protein